MRSIAREVGLTAPALCRHFSSKEELVAAAIERGFERFAATLLSKATAPPTPRVRLRAYREAILEFALRQPRLYETLAYPGDEARGDGSRAAPARRGQARVTATT